LACLGLLGGAVAAICHAGPAPKGIFSKADRKLATVRAVSYRVDARPEGAWKGQLPRIEATVFASAGAERWDRRARPVPQRLRINGELTKPGVVHPVPFSLIVSGDRIVSLNHRERTATVGTLPEAAGLLRVPQLCFLGELVGANPFDDELGSSRLTYEGRERVEGADCHVIHVVYGDGQHEARWYIGVDDSLPHGVDRIVNATEGRGIYTLRLAQIDTSPRFAADVFRASVPSGYEERGYVQPLVSDPRLLPVGTQAPDWTLKAPDGRSVTLSKLRGKIVVLDFWATWCRPCVMAMPGVQRLYEKFRGKPVEVFGVSCREAGGSDPAAFMKKKGFTYGLLLNGERIADAYRVMGIPVFYVIDADGKVAYAASGYDPKREEGLIRLVESLVKELEEE